MRRKIFISYQHSNDQLYYNNFSQYYGDNLQIITDNSLERAIDSSNVEYVMKRIREEHLHGSSCTVVLCGAETPSRKYVDWEIFSSLNQEMGLVGVGLPSIRWDANGGTYKPARLQDNINSGYAEWVLWSDLVKNPGLLLDKIELSLARPRHIINNQRERMFRNG